MAKAAGAKKVSGRELNKVLKRISFFRGFTKAEIDKIASCGVSLIEVDRGGGIIMEGSKESCMYVLLTGQVLVKKTSPSGTSINEVAVLNPGIIFGEISFASTAPRSTSVFAKSPVSMIKINKAILSKMSRALEIKFREKLMDSVIARLDDMNEKLISMSRYI